MKNKIIFYFFITISSITLLLLYYSHLNHENSVNQRYSSIAKKLNLEANTLIEQKKEATLLLALSLAKNEHVKKALLSNNYKALSLKDITDSYTTYTTFKNVWIHLVTNKGVSFIKSWTDRKGENILNIRKDIVSFLKTPKVKTVVSVGKYDMTIKALVPIYEGNKLLGLFEVITKVDSIAKKLSKENVTPIVLVDKKYKKQLKFAFTNTFVNDYYVANLDVSPEILEFTSKLDIESLLKKNKEFQIINNKLLTIHHLKDVHNEEMGYFLLFKDLNKIPIDDIDFKHIIFVLVCLGIMSIIIFLFLFVLNKNYTASLEYEIDKKTKELREINENLKNLVTQETEKNRKNQIKLFQQEKLLQIAEMFRNIAHHWRQPLSVISTELSGINLKLEFNQATEEDIRNSIKNSINKTNELSKNIEFFSKSYNKNLEKQLIELNDCVESAIKVLEPLFQKENIKINLNSEETSLSIKYNKSNFINMIVTILKNSYDSLIQKDEEKFINISLWKNKKEITLEIEDNGKGIDETVRNKIFEPYITTKHQSSGVGLSLYFARNIIVDDLDGTIEAINTQNGVKVTITIPYL